MMSPSPFIWNRHVRVHGDGRRKVREANGEEEHRDLSWRDSLSNKSVAIMQ